MFENQAIQRARSGGGQVGLQVAVDVADMRAAVDQETAVGVLKKVLPPSEIVAQPSYLRLTWSRVGACAILAGKEYNGCRVEGKFVVITMGLNLSEGEMMHMSALHHLDLINILFCVRASH